MEFLRAVRVVAAGDALLSASVTRGGRALRRGPPSQPPPDGLDELTDRERETVALVGRGLSNDEIAERLGISPATARTHVSRARTKLACRDRAQLVIVAYESGLVAPRQVRPNA